MFLSLHPFYFGFSLWSGREVIVKGMAGMKEPDTLIIGIIIEVLEKNIRVWEEMKP